MVLNLTPTTNIAPKDHKIAPKGPKKDKELGLYSLAPNKSKDSICYPKVFSGKVGENVHQFIKEFKTALQADHVRKKDEVKTLMKYLDSHAKTSVGTHTQTLDEAIEILKNTYGIPSLI